MTEQIQIKVHEWEPLICIDIAGSPNFIGIMWVLIKHQQEFLKHNSKFSEGKDLCLDCKRPGFDPGLEDQKQCFAWLDSKVYVKPKIHKILQYWSKNTYKSVE